MAEYVQYSVTVTFGGVTFTLRVTSNDRVVVSATRGNIPLQVRGMRGDVNSLIPHLNTRIADVPGLSKRVLGVIQSEGCEYVGDVVERTEHEWMQVRKFGHTTLRELKDAMAEMGLELGMDFSGVWDRPTPRPDPWNEDSDEDLPLFAQGSGAREAKSGEELGCGPV